MYPRLARISILTILALLVAFAMSIPASTRVAAAAPRTGTTVTLVGSLQSEIGCPGDWQADCAASYLTHDANDDVYRGTFNLPAGSYEYKVALNNSWDENYGAGGAANGGNIALTAPGGNVKFYYDHKSHWITSNINSRIATAAGSFQSELGCSSDWQAECLRSWLQDLDGDGTYTFETDDLAAGNYEFKVAMNETWTENYGAGGAADGSNIAFSVPDSCATTEISFVSSTNTPSVTVTPCGPDIQYFGLGHDSHDTLYRTPFGAITPNTELTLRFRTYHADVTSVQARFWDDAAQDEFVLDMEAVQTDISCYDEAQPDATCDWWQLSYTPTQPTTLYYRFIVRDSTATAYYEDDEQRDGGWGAATASSPDWGWAVTVYDRSFKPISWMQNAVIYQIFPDRFRNGTWTNDPSINEPRYAFPPTALDQIMRKAWGDLPEGYCRAYVNPAQPCAEGPRGRDYFGGDLLGVQQRLNYLKKLGVTAIYFNPIFEAGSNHAYDTQDYYKIDHFFGSNADFENLARLAEKQGIRIILDGVFNHVSSDSPYFDRYGHFNTVGACESVSSPYRGWFTFTPQADGPCAGPGGPNTMTYDAWFGFDSLPVLNKNVQGVRDLFYAKANSVGRYWLSKGADGWRLDVMGDPSFPADFWTGFRSAIKQTNPSTPIIGELWKKFEILPMVRGDKADTAMNYRLRNAVLGMFGVIDNKGFVDDGESDQPPSLFARKLISIREDNPDASYYTMLNILDSHDTKRILWSLTPGESNREDKEFNAANLAAGKQMLRLATVVQMTVPGAPTIFYGDEVGLTGDDDPDDRRTYPWGGEDKALLAHYQKLTALRKANPAFRQGEMTFLLTDDTNRTMAYLLRTNNRAAIVAINRNTTAQTLVIDAKGLLPDAVKLTDALGTVPGNIAAANGVITIQMPGLSAAILQPKPGQDLVPPVATTNLDAIPGEDRVWLDWVNVPKDGRYNVYRSPFMGGGYELIAQTNVSEYWDTTVTPGETYFYVVTARDAAGNEGPFSEEATATPIYAIDWANLQWPPTIDHTVSVTTRTGTIYGRVYIENVTSEAGETTNLRAQAGFGPVGSDPAGNDAWTWVDAAFNTQVNNDDEFMASFLPETPGSYDYVYRYSTGGNWVYADLNGIVPINTVPSNPGKMTVNSSADTTAPDAPANLVVSSASPVMISLSWDAVTGDASLYGYEVLRGTAAGGPYASLGLTTDTTYDDSTVASGQSYTYVVRAVDNSFNRSGNSNEVDATAAPRTVSVTFNVTVPGTTPGDKSVYIAGQLSKLDGSMPDWDAGGVVMTNSGGGVWTITLTGDEDTKVEYKYALGTWDFVEKDNACVEINNRTVTLTYGTTGTQTVNDTVVNWRNVAPCGS